MIITFKENRFDKFLSKTDKLVVFDPHGVITDKLRQKYSTKHKFKMIGRGDV